MGYTEIRNKNFNPRPNLEPHRGLVRVGVYRRTISLLSEKTDLGYWPGKADTSSPLLWSQRKKNDHAKTVEPFSP